MKIITSGQIVSEKKPLLMSASWTLIATQTPLMFHASTKDAKRFWLIALWTLSFSKSGLIIISAFTVSSLSFLFEIQQSKPNTQNSKRSYYSYVVIHPLALFSLWIPVNDRNTGKTDYIMVELQASQTETTPANSVCEADETFNFSFLCNFKFKFIISFNSMIHTNVALQCFPQF